ncbi:MAG: HAD-IA family hydrolase [Chthoniobacter sp.]|uniref:HAD-IA family hydrolase n=1 Tax=Chthoniobacter sp. TaxID=2510640 RepID=UPI0032A3556F
MIKTVFFDAAGTLFHLPRGVGWHYRDVARRFDCHLEENALSDAFRTVWKQMPTRPGSHQPRPDDDKGWWFSLVEQVLDQCRVPAEQLPRLDYFAQLYSEFTRPGIWELFPESLDVLTNLRAHYRLGVISNFDGRLRPILTNLGIIEFFDPIVISSEAGTDKPDPWIFQRALHLADATAAESLHIGDDPRADWEGAEAAGLHIFRLDRPHQTLRDLEKWMKDEGGGMKTGDSLPGAVG